MSRPKPVSDTLAGDAEGWPIERVPKLSIDFSGLLVTAFRHLTASKLSVRSFRQTVIALCHLKQLTLGIGKTDFGCQFTHLLRTLAAVLRVVNRGWGHGTLKEASYPNA